MDSSTPAKVKTGLSLYANLLEPSADSSAPGTISRAPVVFKHTGSDEARQDEKSAQKQQINAAALRFQPTKRPQIASQKQSNKIANPKPTLHAQSSSAPSIASIDIPASVLRAQPKTTIADWTAEGDEDNVNGFYEEKRQRGGRKRRKKNKEEHHVAQNWDDIYDPSRPNNYEEYKQSDEKMQEMREWKDRLYAHRMTRRRSLSSDSDRSYQARPINQFAPPPMAFAPPPERELSPPPPPPPSSPPRPPTSFAPTPAAEVPDDATGEDAYARRLRLSQSQGYSAYAPPAISVIQQSPVPPSTPPAPPAVPPSSVAANTMDSTISRAPVRYNLPPAPSELPKSEEELQEALDGEQDDQEEEGAEDGAAPRSLRPGQKGFAERLMSKYGWTKGSGLGASESGIINPLRVQVEKQKKRPDSEGGGFVGPGGRGKIIGGKKKGGDDAGKFGPMSDVVILHGMVNGMDLQRELGDGNLMQEIGEECGEKYGRVERVYINQSVPDNPPVFVKFTSQLSALRAVNALEGRVFNGNTITAKFFDSDKFEKGVYF